MGIFKKIHQKAAGYVERLEEQERQQIADDFYYKHESFVSRWEERIDSAIDCCNENPEKVLQSFEKAFALCDEFKAACLSYSGGAEYFLKDGFRFREGVQRDLDDYMKYEYEEALENWNEIVADREFRKSVKKKLLDAVRKSGTISQVDLKKVLTDDESRIYNSAIKLLEDGGRIVREKRNNRVVFTYSRK